MSIRSIAYLIKVLASHKYDDNRKFLIICSFFADSGNPMAQYLMQFYNFSVKYPHEIMEFTDGKVQITFEEW